MIINHPEHHMTDSQNRLRENSPVSSNNTRGRLFEMIMNNNPGAAPTAGLPLTTSSLPAEIFVRKDSPASDNSFQNNSACVDGKKNKDVGNGSSVRMTIAGNTSEIPSNAVRQKIDFQSGPPSREMTTLNNRRVQIEILKDLPALPGAYPGLPDCLVSSINSNKASGTGFSSIAIQTKDQTMPVIVASQQESENKPVSNLEKLVAGPPPFREHELEYEKRKKISSAYKEHAAYKTAEAPVKNRAVEQEQFQPGQLAAKFESANSPGAIGYDRRGGTCYGIYQLSSRMGTMGEFLEFLDVKAPDISERLRQAGPADSRGRSGPMPREWKSINKEQPERFTNLQHEFIYENFYVPAARGVEARTGLKMENAPPALREVLWSTAVQHGVHGAMNIFQRAAESIDLKNSAPTNREIIQAVYSERQTRFKGSTDAVRVAVQNRFSQEMKMALAMLPGTADARA